ncbi:hypothetical protein FO519_009887, partial [Halicephalobus sp. NKZ332]
MKSTCLSLILVAAVVQYSESCLRTPGAGGAAVALPGPCTANCNVNGLALFTGDGTNSVTPVIGTQDNSAGCLTVDVDCP